MHDIVRFAKEREILCQGRGSAANSAICYCLGITSIDPAEGNSLFARFISAERGEKPDIDVDFEHQRREEVIQYVYDKYGRDRAGLAATVIRYRSRAAIRDVGKAMGLSVDVTQALSKTIWGWSNERLPEDQVRQAGLDPEDWRLAVSLRLAHALTTFPRHLSQHVGGMVISRGPLSSLVPIENAAMENRTVIQWDKDDLESLGLMKVDILALGMLTCIRKAFDLIVQPGQDKLTLATVPPDDRETYDMLCRADTIGVFQVESRAQMSMLPRLKPKELYDLTIEVAIVRPGPIQGDMVHPYLRRREGKELGDFYQGREELKKILGKTKGVPLFQEQAMKIAIDCAGFTPDQSDGLRRSMATFRHNGDVNKYREPFMAGMKKNGYDMDFAERCFKQIEGFGNYGFPESHAASFALLAYISAWIKCRHPAVFAAALLNSQPMGFYQPAQIVQDAAAHGVEVRPVDVNLSDWDCTLEPSAETDPRVKPGDDAVIKNVVMPGLDPGISRRLCNPALRLGFRQAKGVAESEIAKLIAARGSGYRSAEQLWRRAGLDSRSLARLAEADAFRSLGLDRRQALWAVKGLGEAPLPLFAAQEAAPVEESGADIEINLPEMPLSQHVIEDYRSLQLSLKRHPMTFSARPAVPPRDSLQQGPFRVPQRTARAGRGACAGASAAGDRQRHHLHDLGGRDRHRQSGGLAGYVPEIPPHRDDREAGRLRRQAADRRDVAASGDPCGGGTFDRSHRRTRCLARGWAAAARKRDPYGNDADPDCQGRCRLASAFPPRSARWADPQWTDGGGRSGYSQPGFPLRRSRDLN